MAKKSMKVDIQDVIVVEDHTQYLKNTVYVEFALEN